jgi:hypothetical protein
MKIRLSVYALLQLLKRMTENRILTAMGNSVCPFKYFPERKYYTACGGKCSVFVSADAGAVKIHHATHVFFVSFNRSIRFFC